MGRRGAQWLLVCVPLIGNVLAQPAPELQADSPRAYGYTVGSVVQRRVQLQLPPGWSLDMNSLPRTRRPGQPIELRSATLNGAELQLAYQVFLAPTEVRTLELPPLRLRVTGPAGERELRVEAWPVTVAPLAPENVSPREGLGAMRPDVAAPAIDTQPRQRRLLAMALALAALGLALFHLKLGLPWTARRQRPFARAWRELRGAPDAAAPDTTRAAMKRMHQALNDSAGHVLFATGLGEFLDRQPRFATLQSELHEFFERSQAQFFAAAPAPALAADMAWLKRLCRQCLQAEQGVD